MFGVESLVISGNGPARVVNGEFVSGNFFETAGVPAALGRILEPSDDSPTAAPVAVLSYPFWQSTFDGKAGIVGSTIHLSNHRDGLTVTVVGIASRYFPSIRPGDVREVWLPGSLQSQLDSGRFKRKSAILAAYDTGDDDWRVYILSRLKHGVSLRQAQTAANVVFQNHIFHGPFPPFEAKDAPRVLLVPAQDAIVGRKAQFTTPIAILMGAAGVVLLIACANVAGLTLARAATRRKEMALRFVLGAGRIRLARQFLTESVMLSVAGGAIGLLLAYWSAHALATLVTHGNFEAQMDAKTLAFSAAISVVTGIAFGFAPALRGTRVDLTPALNESTGSPAISHDGGRRWFRLGNALVVTQVALSIVVLIGAGLFVRTLKDLKSVDPGFDTKGILLFGIDPSLMGSSDAQLQVLYSQLQDRLGALPGVISVTHSSSVLLNGSYWKSSFKIRAATGDTRGISEMLAVGPNFFETMRIPLLAGRKFAASDFESVKKLEPAVVNQSFAREFFGDTNPLGRQIGDIGRDGMECQIVGVVADTRYTALRTAARSIAYTPQVYGNTYFEVRTAGNPNGLIPEVRDVVHQLDSKLPVGTISTQAVRIDRALDQERLIAQLSSLFGLLALLLACIGLYGLLSYEVTRRTREIGIRVALGAQRRDILRLVVGQGIVLVLFGSAAGIAIALGVMRTMASLLYGVSPTDPVTYAGVAALLTGVAMAASYIPARRATKVDPLVALRHE